MITVIADDITGAAEIAGVCLRYGLKVTFGIDSVPEAKCDVCVISTDSRSATELEAYRTHYGLAKTIFRDTETVVFKKCDSALRGYVLTELSAILDVKKFTKVLLQAANPLSGRCIRDGIYMVGNEKIENTAFARDPDFPADVSEVQKLLVCRSPRYNHITEFHTGYISALPATGLTIPDCSSVEELSNCANLSDVDTLLCGSAAFFEQVLLKTGKTLEATIQPASIISSDFLLVSGSTQSASRCAVDGQSGNNCPIVSFPESLLQVKSGKGDIETFAEELSKIWAINKRLNLTISENKISFPGSSTILKQRMALIVKQLVQKCEIKELFIEGGATTCSILDLLNWKTLIPVEELSPGVVRMEIEGLPDIHLTIKPGSYSWPESLTALFS
ncbi:MAG: four-carbon acid sugar kinase family protein [Paludibacter sp.]|nr:four-carbon acid sugar kinase family protein [Paludibacter sp.]